MFDVTDELIDKLETDSTRRVRIAQAHPIGVAIRNLIYDTASGNFTTESIAEQHAYVLLNLGYILENYKHDDGEPLRERLTHGYEKAVHTVLRYITTGEEPTNRPVLMAALLQRIDRLKRHVADLSNLVHKGEIPDSVDDPEYENLVSAITVLRRRSDQLDQVVAEREGAYLANKEYEKENEKLRQMLEKLKQAKIENNSDELLFGMLDEIRTKVDSLHKRLG